jgi:signal transduction histidine kinase
MDLEIRQTVRKLLIKFVILQAVIFGAAVVLSISFTAYFKHRLGSQLAAASRDALLSGDSRRAITDLSTAALKDFSSLRWTPYMGEDGFLIPPGGATIPGIGNSATRILIYYDSEKRSKAGELFFTYPRWTPALWGVLAWLAIFGLTLPMAINERKRLINDYKLLLELRIKESFEVFAAQVAHDIRSPLAALSSAAATLDASVEQRQLISGAVGRIGDIAEDLLHRYRKPEEAVPSKAAACRIDTVIGQVVEEKRLQFAAKPGLKILFESRGISAIAEPRELQRLVSNLMNNAMEACGQTGVIKISVTSSGDKALISVEDSGKGIPPEILAKLGKKGETHGKAGGTGLGLYHAREKTESWGGKLRIESEPGKGTRVTAELQLAGQPLAADSAAVLLDDDPLVHMNWKMAAKSAGTTLTAYRAPDELLNALGSIPKDARIFIDSELGNGVKGEDIACRLHDLGFTCISMTTGHGPEKFAHLKWLKVSGKEPPWDQPQL